VEPSLPYKPVAEEHRRHYRSLTRDMHLALLSEIGARSIYDHLRRHVKDDELRRLLVKLNEEGIESVALLQELIRSMGARAKRTSLRRRALARLLALASRVIGVRIVLRICYNAEDTVSRWYSEYRHYLLSLDDVERAQTCERLAVAKRLHAQALETWIAHSRNR